MSRFSRNIRTTPQGAALEKKQLARRFKYMLLLVKNIAASHTDVKTNVWSCKVRQIARIYFPPTEQYLLLTPTNGIQVSEKIRQDGRLITTPTYTASHVYPAMRRPISEFRRHVTDAVKQMILDWMDVENDEWDALSSKE